MQQTIIFRCTSNSKVGLGHLTRCIAIAREMKDKYNLIFATDPDKTNSIIKKNNFRIFLMEKNESEEEYLIRLNKEFEPELMVLDKKYPYTEDLIIKLKSSGCKMVIMDNICGGIKAADEIIFPNAHLDKDLLKKYLSEKEIERVKSGPEYVIIRDEIIKLKDKLKKSHNNPPKVVITTGGSDPEGVLLKILQLLLKGDLNAEFTFLIGQAFLHRDELDSIISDLPNNFKIREYSPDEFINADLVVCTFGVTVYEMIYLQIPTIYISHNLENDSSALELSKKIRIDYLGYFGNLDFKTLNSHITRVLKFNISDLSCVNNKELIGGYGTKKIGNLLKGLKNGEKKFLSKDDTIHYGKIQYEMGEYTVIECENCGFKHIIPIPEQKELNKFYEKEFYSQEKPLYIKETNEDNDWWKLHYNFYYDLFEKNLNSNSKKLLEIGSGPGLFLNVGIEKDWDVMGFEPSKLAYKYSKKFNLNVENGFFDIEKISDKYDVVYMNTVIEHVPDPINLIKDVKSILKPDGLVCIIAPNDYNPLQNILEDELHFEPYWISPPQHISYFNFSSIKKLFEKLDFEVIESLGTFPMEFFILSGKNYVNNDSLGRKCHNSRKNFEQNIGRNNKHLLINFYYFLAENNLGREFIVIAKLKGK